MRTTTLTLVDGTRIVVPDALHLMTPYVLAEQGDWFEDDIRFVRTVLQPGDAAIDIGANHGVYALSMAQAVGAAGRVWAYEPASGVRGLLEASVAANGFGERITVIGSALSDRDGEAALALHAQPELNRLHAAAAVPGPAPSSACRWRGSTPSGPASAGAASTSSRSMLKARKHASWPARAAAWALCRRW